jgi:amphi-Trp domain-containing protein
MAGTFELEDEPAAELEVVDDDADSEAQPGEARRESKEKGKIKFESVMQRSEAAIYFGALVDGLRQGQLQFRHGEENLSLAPAQQVVVEVKASKKGDKEKVAFELEWRRSGDEAAPSSG